MLYQEMVEGLILPTFAKSQLELLCDKSLCGVIKNLDLLKIYSTEFLDKADIKSFNQNGTLYKKVIAHNKRVEIKASASCDEFNLSRSDSYIEEKLPFCRIGMSVQPNKVFFALYQAKHDNSDESCYVFSYVNQSKLDKAEVIENGHKQVFDLKEIEI